VRCAEGFLCGGVLRGASAVNPPVIALADYKISLESLSILVHPVRTRTCTAVGGTREGVGGWGDGTARRVASFMGAAGGSLQGFRWSGVVTR
jgi:hypothetical protein